MLAATQIICFFAVIVVCVSITLLEQANLSERSDVRDGDWRRSVTEKTTKHKRVKRDVESKDPEYRKWRKWYLTQRETWRAKTKEAKEKNEPKANEAYKAYLDLMNTCKAKSLRRVARAALYERDDGEKNRDKDQVKVPAVKIKLSRLRPLRTPLLEQSEEELQESIAILQINIAEEALRRKLKRDQGVVERARLSMKMLKINLNTIIEKIRCKASKTRGRRSTPLAGGTSPGRAGRARGRRSTPLTGGTSPGRAGRARGRRSPAPTEETVIHRRPKRYFRRRRAPPRRRYRPKPRSRSGYRWKPKPKPPPPKPKPKPPPPKPKPKPPPPKPKPAPTKKTSVLKSNPTTPDAYFALMARMAKIDYLMTEKQFKNIILFYNTQVGKWKTKCKGTAVDVSRSKRENPKRQIESEARKRLVEKYLRLKREKQAEDKRQADRALNAVGERRRLEVIVEGLQKRLDNLIDKCHPNRMKRSPNESYTIRMSQRGRSSKPAKPTQPVRPPATHQPAVSRRNKTGGTQQKEAKRQRRIVESNATHTEQNNTWERHQTTDSRMSRLGLWPQMADIVHNMRKKMGVFVRVLVTKFTWNSHSPKSEKSNTKHH